MKNISSFILSVSIHILLVVALAGSYLTIQKRLEANKTSNEKLLCIDLASYKPCPIPKKDHTTTFKKETKPKKKSKKNTPKTTRKKVKKEIEKKKKEPKHSIQKTTTAKQKKIETKTTKLQTKISQKRATANTKKKNLPAKKCIKEASKQKQNKSYTSRYISKNISIIRKLIAENLYYPRKARRRHIEGTVKVRFTLTQDGKISEMQIISNSPKILSKAAVTTLQDIEDLLPHPDEEITITLPIVYKIVEEN